MCEIALYSMRKMATFLYETDSWMGFFFKINDGKKPVKFWFDDKEATDRLRGN